VVRIEYCGVHGLKQEEVVVNKHTWFHSLFMGLALLSVGSVVACGQLAPSSASPTQTSVVEPEPEIPPNFITYTSEGLFSISYPPDLILDTESMETYAKIPLEDLRLVFDGDIPIEGGSYVFLTVMVSLMPAGLTLDELPEYGCEYLRNNQPGFLLYSQDKTVVDGREAVILKYRIWGLDIGEWHNLDIFIVKDSLVWWVSCYAEPEDFKDYEDTFYSILRSVRILTHWWTRWTM